MSSELVNYSTGTTVTANWLNRAQLREEGLATYVIYSAGGTFYAKALAPAGVDYSNTDAATVIQNAINAISSSLGGTVYVKPATYTVNPTTVGGIAYALLLKSNVNLIIDGILKLQNNANILSGSNTFMLRIPDGSDNVYARINEIDGNNTNQTNPANTYRCYGLEVGNSTNIAIERSYVHDTSETGIAVEGASNNVWISKCHTLRTGLGGFDGIGNQYTSSNVYYDTCLADACGSATYGGVGFTVEGGEGIHLTDCTARNNPNEGLKIQRSIATAPISVNIAGFRAYQNLYGINILSNTERVSITAPKIFKNNAEGIVITSASNIDIQGGSVWNNDFTQTQHSGILLAGATDCSIIGTCCYDDQVTKTQDYGIALISSADRNNIIGGSVRSNQTGGIYTVGAGTGNRISGVDGYNPLGIAAISVGASPFTYTNTDNVSEAVYIFGGTVSQIAKNSVNLFTSTDKTVWLEPGEAVVVTYSSAPTMKADRK